MLNPYSELEYGLNDVTVQEQGRRYDGEAAVVTSAVGTVETVMVAFYWR